MSTAFLVVSLLLLMALGMPVAISLGLSSILTILLFADDSLASLSIKLYETSEHYTLLSIPFFILAGTMMSTGGVAKRMVRFAVTTVGHLRGGLAIASGWPALCLPRYLVQAPPPWWPSGPLSSPAWSRAATPRHSPPG